MTHRPITLPAGLTPQPLNDQPAPLLQWIEIAAMVIDDTYQRPITHGGWKTIYAIAANFQWSCFTPVLLAPIEGGLFAVIDGQHRVHAAQLRGIERVPAMIVHIGVQSQASAFVQVNRVRTGMSQFNLLKAGLAAGEEWAVTANRVVAEAGCRLMSFTPSTQHKKPGDVLSVGLVRDMVAKGQGRAVTVALTALRRIEDGMGSGAVLLYADKIIAPLMRAVADHPSLDADTLTAALRTRRILNLVESAERLAQKEHRSPAVVRREAFAILIRTHLREVAA